MSEQAADLPQSKIAELEAQITELEERLFPEKFEMSADQLQEKQAAHVAAVTADRFGPERQMDPYAGLPGLNVTITNPRPSIESKIVQPKAYRG